jgi:ankyrin repeat protein
MLPRQMRLFEEKAKVGINARDIEKTTPLSWAARNGHVSIAKELFLKGAETNLGDRNGQTSPLREDSTKI